MCRCDIVCQCNADSPSVSVHPATVNDASVGACLLGKTRPPESSAVRDDQLNLFNISNEYRSYAYTLSPQGVGIMAHKSRDQQYKTLKRLHSEVLSNYECSYIITTEIYPGNDNALHCHGLIRFRSHNKKEQFKKELKDKLTLFKKGTFSNLIDCEFVNSFENWSQYIIKSQESIIPLGYFPFIKIDHSFHISNNQITAITVPVSLKTRLKTKMRLEAQLQKAQSKVNNLLSQISSL